MSEGSQRPPAARWRDGGDGAPGGARDLLAAARRPRPMSGEERARSAARVAAIAAFPVATGAAVASKWAGGKILALFAGFGLLGAGVGLTLFLLGGPKTTVDTSKPVVTSTARVSSEPAALTASVTASVTSPVTPTPTPSATVTATGTGTGAATAPKPSASASAAGDSLVAETAILEKARGLIGSDPAAALAVCEAHRKEYPAGKLSAERELLAIDALKRLGRNAEARQRGEAFIANNPKSLYIERVRKLIEGL